MNFTYNVRIVDVVDGDTVKVDIDMGFSMWMMNQNIRLLGIDAPESRTKDLVEKKFGLLTKSIVEQYLPIGSMQQMVTTKEGRGKFGRILGEFLVNQPELSTPTRFNLNRYLVDNHYAVKYNGQSSRDVLQAKHHENRMILIEKGEVID